MDITHIAGRVRTRLAFLIVGVGSLMLGLYPATAGAQQVTDAQYNSTLQLLQSGGEPPPSNPPSSETLPFTGLDVMALLGVGAALAAAGFFLWRHSRTSTTEISA